MDERAKALSRQHHEVLGRVKAVIDQEDPEGLLYFGCPPDEYDDAVAEFTRRVLKGEPLDPMAIVEWFDRVYGNQPSGAETLSEALHVPSRDDRRRRTHCPLCGERLARNSIRSRLERRCGSCGGTLQATLRCTHCSTNRVWQGSAGAFCHGCGHEYITT